MKFSINKGVFDKALQICGNAISARSTIPTLAGVLIKANEDEITLLATDMELSIQVNKPALIEQEGESLIPWRLLSEIVKTLPDEAISITTSNSNVEIACGKSNFNIRSMSSEDFPEFPHVEPDKSAEIPFEEFSTMIKKVAKMTSKDETRSILQGVNITINEGKLEMVATDAYRIEITSCGLSGSAASVEGFSCVIRGDFLSDVTTLDKNTKSLTISTSKNHVVITTKDVVFINRRIDGNFPNYEQLIPKDIPLRVKLDKRALASAVNRISVVNDVTPVVTLNFDVTSSTVELSGDAQDVGSVNETLKCEVLDSSVQDLTISFNCNYIIEGLSTIDSSSVILEFVNSTKPGLFLDENPDNSTYLLLPVNISR